MFASRLDSLHAKTTTRQGRTTTCPAGLKVLYAVFKEIGNA
jgi:hypothetical protein